MVDASRFSPEIIGDHWVRPRLYTMAPDGSDRRLLRTGVVAPLSPLWSPDGEYLAYVKSDGKKAHIYTYAIGGTKSQRLTEAVSRPAWSPDGQRIAFAKPDGDGVALYTIAADGTDAQRVTTIEGWRRVAAAGRFREPDDELDPAWAFIETVAWSPSGEHILYTCDPTICVVSLDGTPVGQAPVAPIAEKRVLVAAWSPDGSRIALTHPELPHPMVLYTMAPDGTDVQVLVEMGDVGLVAAQASAEDAAASRAACQAGFVVHDPAANPGLVRDCEVLLELRDALFQGRLVNWGGGSADRPVGGRHGGRRAAAGDGTGAGDRRAPLAGPRAAVATADLARRGIHEPHPARIGPTRASAGVDAPLTAGGAALLAPIRGLYPA